MSLIQSLSRNLVELKAQCGKWRKRKIKELIAIAEDNIAKFEPNHPRTLDFQKQIDPFIEAYENEGDNFQLISLTAFIDIFSNLSPDLCPEFDTLDRVIRSLFTTDKTVSDNQKLLCCKLVLLCISSPTGTYFMHGTINYKVLGFLIAMYRISDTQYALDNISNTIHDIIDYYLKVYRKPIKYPTFKTIKEIATFHSSLLVYNSTFIGEFAPNSRFSQISDVDLILLIRSFTTKITNSNNNDNLVSVIMLCCDGIYHILDSNSPFTQTPDFEVVMKTDIHVALLTLTLDTHPELVEPTAKLISICWSKYARIYLQELNDILIQGLIAALSSSLSEVIERAFDVFSRLIEHPQFLIDAFVNYDCDHSGSFRNIFEKTVNLIVNNAYPNQVAQEHQIKALKTIVLILSALWKYFTYFENKKIKDPAEEQNLLDAKKAKDIIDHASQLFKRSPKKGLQFFIDQRYIENTPESIADFLYNSPLLDPAGVGEIIGNENNVNILKHYVEHFDFKKMSFEHGFREFLSKFVIPGEAQMIDRIMEQFGVKYYNDNTNLFSCADTVYVLAFSTLMLHTDAHHPNVKTRMTLDEFIANNKGIDGGKDLPFSFLESLYNNITSERIFVSQSPMPSSSLLTRQQLKELYQQQCKETLNVALKKTNSLGPNMIRKYHRAESPKLVGPIFHIIWGQILAALTMSFEASDDPQIYQECIRGFELCMHIASHCYVEDALDTLVDSFAKFSRLRIHTNELKPKNLRISISLINCAIQDHNYLKGVWSIVLSEISAMDKMRENVSIAKNLIVAENLFSETLSLDRESILDFVKSMCELAQAEIQEKPPRPYLLTKFSDVAYYNMDRPMFIWKDIWTIIGSFLASAGKSDNESIAATVVDVIRQLSKKFLRKKEINEFHFQQHFLQPFIDIFDSQPNLKIKQHVLLCIYQIIEELSTVLHSGWDVIFQILTLASLENSSLKNKAYKLMDAIITTYLDSASNEKVHLMFVLMSFVQNLPEDLSFSAVGRFSLISNIIQPTDHNGWECLFQTLTKCTLMPSEKVKLCAEEALLSIVTIHGIQNNEFDDYLWNFFFENVLKKIFAVKSAHDYGKNRLQMFKLMFDHLFFKHSAFFGKYSLNIFNLILVCCKFPNRELSFLALKYLCNYLGDDESLKSTLPNIKLFVDPLISTIPELVKLDTSSVMIVDIVDKTLGLCSDDISKRKYLIEVLFNMCDKCTGNALCSALKLTYRTLLYDENYDSLIEFIPKPFEKYLNVKDSNKTEWDNTLIYFIREINKSDDLYFRQYVKSLKNVIKSFIETDSFDVRIELEVILNRYFLNNT